MARPREFDTEVALEAALQTFRELGYEAASMRDLSARMGLHRGSLYGAFSDKRKLFLAALERCRSQEILRLTEFLEARTPVRANLYRWLMAEAQRLEGCLVVASTLELAARDPEVCGLLREHQSQSEAILRRALERGMASGEFAPETEVSVAAGYLLITASGLSARSRLGPGEHLEAIVEQTLAGLQ